MFFRFAGAIEGLLDSAPPDLNKSFLANEFYGPAKAIAKAGLSLGTKDMAAFYELMTAPITKILGHWFESEPLTASLATDALIGTMVIKMLFFITKIENTPLFQPWFRSNFLSKGITKNTWLGICPTASRDGRS